MQRKQQAKFQRARLVQHLRHVLLQLGAAGVLVEAHLELPQGGRIDGALIEAPLDHSLRASTRDD